MDSFTRYGVSGIQPSAFAAYNSGVKNFKTHGRDEGDFYRALARAVVDDPKALETEVQTCPKRVGAYKLRQRLPQLVDKVSGLPHLKN